METVLYLALAVSFLTDAVKLLSPRPVPPGFKPLVALVVTVGLGQIVGLSVTSVIGVLGLAHLIHNIVRLLSGLGDYYRVQAMLSLPQTRRNIR